MCGRFLVGPMTPGESTVPMVTTSTPQELTVDNTVGGDTNSSQGVNFTTDSSRDTTKQTTLPPEKSTSDGFSQFPSEGMPQDPSLPPVRPPELLPGFIPNSNQGIPDAADVLFDQMMNRLGSQNATTDLVSISHRRLNAKDT